MGCGSSTVADGTVSSAASPDNEVKLISAHSEEPGQTQKINESPSDADAIATTEEKEKKKKKVVSLDDDSPPSSPGLGPRLPITEETFNTPKVPALSLPVAAIEPASISPKQGEKTKKKKKSSSDDVDDAETEALRMRIMQQTDDLEEAANGSRSPRSKNGTTTHAAAATAAGSSNKKKSDREREKATEKERKRKEKEEKKKHAQEEEMKANTPATTAAASTTRTQPLQPSESDDNNSPFGVKQWNDSQSVRDVPTRRAASTTTAATSSQSAIVTLPNPPAPVMQLPTWQIGFDNDKFRRANDSANGKIISPAAVRSTGGGVDADTDDLQVDTARVPARSQESFVATFTTQQKEHGKKTSEQKNTDNNINHLPIAMRTNSTLTHEDEALLDDLLAEH